MTTKTKKVITKNVTETQFNDSFQRYAVLDAQQTAILANIDEKIAQLRSQHEAELNDIKTEKEKTFALIQVYCTENAQLFEKKKSYETLHGTVGFRTGTPKLKNLKGHTWASVTTLLKEFFPNYVRTIQEPAKDLILAHRDTWTPSDLQKAGIEIVQDETFYIDLKKEVVKG